MRARAPFVVGILAIVAVVAWLLLRKSDNATSNEPPRTGSGALTQGGARSAPEAPALPGGSSSPASGPALPPQPPTPTAEDTFSEEDRDDAWAARTEPELKKRWKAIRGGKLDSVECKKTQCKLVVTGPEQDLAMAVADLEGPRGLHGYAENVLLTAPQQNPDGTIVLRIYAKFDR
jgi:hypothetical protein